MKRKILVAALLSVYAGGAAVAAEPADSKTLGTQSAQMDSLATSQGNLKVESRISSDFNAFAGSTDNSSSLVTGLRSGTPITLSSTDANGVVTTMPPFTPATGKMGYGNVYTSLALAKNQLAGLGITQPTPQEIQAALNGGTVTIPGTNPPQTTTLTGVLTLRAQGMGWGQIAQTQGTKLGPVISGMKSANGQISSPTSAASAKSAPASGVTKASGATSGGVTTAAGGSNPGKGNAYGHGITTGAGGSAGQGGGNAYGRGITTGAGGSAGQGGGNAYGHGITTGAGGAPGQSGTAGSQSRGAGKGG